MERVGYEEKYEKSRTPDILKNRIKAEGQCTTKVGRKWHIHFDRKRSICGRVRTVIKKLNSSIFQNG